jgi:hypothetical protein
MTAGVDSSVVWGYYIRVVFRCVSAGRSRLQPEQFKKRWHCGPLPPERVRFLYSALISSKNKSAPLSAKGPMRLRAASRWSQTRLRVTRSGSPAISSRTRAASASISGVRNLTSRGSMTTGTFLAEVFVTCGRIGPRVRYCARKSRLSTGESGGLISNRSFIRSPTLSADLSNVSHHALYPRGVGFSWLRH